MAEPSEPKRLLHVFSTFAVGGPQTRFVALANSWGARYRHDILAMDGDFAAAAGLAPEVPFRIERMRVRRSAGLSAANIWTARQILRRLRPDCLITYNWGAIEWTLANWRHLSNHIHVEDGFGPDETPDRQKRARVLARRLLLGRADRIVVPSALLRDIAVSVWRLPAANIAHLPNGIDCARFARTPDPALLAALGIAAGRPVVGTVAGLRPEKNLARLVRVFAALPRELEALLVIVGDGPERAAIAALARAAGVAGSTILAGALAEPERVLGRFTVFALTSDTEQMPNAMIEAMAAGLPVVATDVGDVKRLVAPENAPLVLSRADEAALAHALETLLRDAGRRAVLGRANAARARAEYRFAVMADRWESLFAAARDARTS